MAFEAGRAVRHRRVPSIRASRPNAYTGSPLDRAAQLRDDTDWIFDARVAPDTLWVPLWGSRSLLAGHGTERVAAILPTGAEAALLGFSYSRWAFLGRLDGTPVFAGQLDGDAEPAVEGGSFVDLRAAMGILPARDAAILAHARGLMHWRARHGCCANCGHATEPRSAGNVTACPACGAQHFPRTDPAVIMLVTHGDRALLGHSARFPTATMFSTLAGFVEPGESLEEAVAREVFEEAGVRVRDVTYHSSQPWPFPASLMVGFHAEADDPTLAIDPEELTEARWFGRAELLNPPRYGFDLPHGDSIARRLIEDWLCA